MDVSGGPNNYPLGSFQCITTGYECWKFDWMREIWGVVLSDPNDPISSKMEIMDHLSNNYNEVLDATYGYNNSYEQSDGEMPEFPIEDCQRFIFYGNGIVGYAWEW